MEEIWKDIEGYEGIYQVSNMGRVKSLPRKMRNGAGYKMSKERILKNNWCEGYAYVHLYDKEKHRVARSVHRLVALAFVPKDRDLPNLQVGHKDEDSKNNRADNLEWVTPKENSNTQLRRERIAIKAKQRTVTEETRRKRSIAMRGGNSATARKVVCDGVEYGCMMECAEHYNVDRHAISNWLRGKRKMPKRFIDLGLRFVEE